MMQVRIFTIPFNSNLGIFDDGALNDFSKDKEIVGINDYLFTRNEIPYLTLVVKYNQTALSLASTSLSPPAKATKKADPEEWRKLLDENSMPLFNTLREWRSEKSKKDGVPPYIILNNKQLAEVVQKRPQSKHDLMTIDGIGKAKAEKYGDAILKVTLYQTNEENHEHTNK